jgi:hypothetical protein
LVPGNPDELCKEPAWVNNYNSVTITETRQGGEDGGFTLVNNFAGVGDAFDHVPEVNAVRVKDCQCYATFGNIYGPNSSVIYAQPAILRYVSAIPNITAIEDNIGLILAKAIDFSKEEFEEDTESIQEMISESGATGNVVPFGVSVKVTNNVGGLPHSNGSHVPSELWQFVRDDDSLWPSKRGNELAPIGAPAAGSGSSVRFSFDYGSNLNTAYLINYVGFPNPGGSTSYSGGFVGLLKANGFYTGTDIAQSLALEPLFNKIGDGPDPSMWPTGMFSVNVCWEATDSDVMLDSVTNHNFYIEVTGGSLGYDSIKVTPLNSL